MKHHIPFVIQGDYSKQFLEKMGYKPFHPLPVETSKNPVMPLRTLVKGLFPKIEKKKLKTQISLLNNEKIKG